MLISVSVNSQTAWTRVGCGGLNGFTVMKMGPARVVEMFWRVFTLWVRQAIGGWLLRLWSGDIM